MARRRIGQENLVARAEPRATSSLPDLGLIGEPDLYVVGCDDLVARW